MNEINPSTMAAPARETMNSKPVFTVPARTAVNFESGFGKKLLCDGITFTAGNACVYDCTYCYVEDMQRKAMGWHEKHGVVYPPAGHAGVVIRINDAATLARKQIASKPLALRQSKKVIYSSPKVDVAGNMELVRETVEICKAILELTNWDIRLLSKSNALPVVARMIDEEYIRGRTNPGGTSGIPYRDPRKAIIYGVSTGTLNEKLSAAIEPKTANVAQRIKSLHKLQDNGFRTFGMICPSLPLSQAADGAYTKFSQEVCKAIRVEKCEHVWCEVINARGDSFTKTYAALQGAGFHDEAADLKRVSEDQSAWEHYARATFMGHTANIAGDKLRFLQYVTNSTRAWWESQVQKGAVIL